MIGQRVRTDELSRDHPISATRIPPLGRLVVIEHRPDEDERYTANGVDISADEDAEDDGAGAIFTNLDFIWEMSG